MPHPVPLLRRALVVGAAAGLVLALAGCVGGTPDPTDTGSPSPSTTRSATATPSATPTSTPTPTGTPVALTCEQLITAEQVYDFNPNYGTDPGYKPASGTLPAKVAAQNGRTCSLLNQTSGETVEIAVAQPASSTLTSFKNAAITDSQPVPTYGVPPQVEGYFTVDDGVGVAQIFQGSYWVVIRSSVMLEPGDAAPIAADVQGNLPAS